MVVCERCRCIDFQGDEGVTHRADVTLNGVRGVRLCDYCYGRVVGAEPDPLTLADATGTEAS